MKHCYAILILILALCANCTSRSARIAVAQKKATILMQNIGYAWERACASGQVQTVQAQEVESVSIFQGRVSTLGHSNAHLITGQDLKEMHKNIASLRPGSPVAVSIFADREEFKGSFPIHCAMEVSALTLAEGTIIITPSGSIALVHSAYKGDIATIEDLISRGADVNEQSKVSPLMAAADNNQAAALLLLLKKGARVNDRSVFNGMTALHFSARKGYNDLVNHLINSGANLELTDNDGFTPLWSTAFTDKGATIELLLRKGANIRHLDANGNNIITAAAANGSNKTIQLLVARGVDPGNKNKFGRTALFDAIEHNKIDTVRLLISYKVDLNIRTASNKSPLAVARQMGFSEIVRILQEAGAK